MLTATEEFELLQLLEIEHFEQAVASLDPDDREWFKAINENLPEDGDYRNFFKSLGIDELKRYERILKELWRSEQDAYRT